MDQGDQVRKDRQGMPGTQRASKFGYFSDTCIILYYHIYHCLSIVRLLQSHRLIQWTELLELSNSTLAGKRFMSPWPVLETRKPRSEH